MTSPRIFWLCAWTKAVVESTAWSYLVVNEPAARHMAKVRFLAGYRRECLVDQDVLAQFRCLREDLVGRSIARPKILITGCPPPLVRPALLSMLWHRELEVNLDLRLDRSTILVEVVKPAAVRVGLGMRFAYDGEVLEVIESHHVAGTPELLTKDLRTDAVRRPALDEMRPSDRYHLLADEAPGVRESVERCLDPHPVASGISKAAEQQVELQSPDLRRCPTQGDDGTVERSMAPRYGRQRKGLSTRVLTITFS
jgi:hypothetical protein